MDSFKKYVAEFIGTLVLVLFACGTAVLCECNVSGGYLITALAFGLVIVAMAYSIGNISGCHINPAVSIAMLVSGKMGIKDFIGYVIAQFSGAIAGSAILWAIVGKENGLAQNFLYDGSVLKTFIIEVILTFVFVIAILGVTSKVENGAVAGIVIGLSLTLVHILGISLTGTSVNPARSFAPALFMGGNSLEIVWIFILAPLVGGVLAALVYMFLSSKSKNKKSVEAIDTETPAE